MDLGSSSGKGWAPGRAQGRVGLRVGLGSGSLRLSTWLSDASPSRGLAVAGASSTCDARTETRRPAPPPPRRATASTSHVWLLDREGAAEQRRSVSCAQSCPPLSSACHRARCCQEIRPVAIGQSSSSGESSVEGCETQMTSLRCYSMFEMFITGEYRGIPHKMTNSTGSEPANYKLVRRHACRKNSKDPGRCFIYPIFNVETRKTGLES